MTNLTFCWNGFVSTDIDKTLAFFPAVLGWEAKEVTMGPDTMHMFHADGGAVGHIRGPAMEGEPSWWNNYLRVEDVDAACETLTANGGKVVVPGTDIPPGRFATVTLPSGAYFTFFRESDDGDSAASGVAWVDLHSKDLAADLACLKALGLDSNGMQMPGGDYHMLLPETSHAGAMAGQNPEAPSMWAAWVGVPDTDATLAKVEGAGGSIIAPAWDVPGVGRLALAADPAGIVFGLMTPPSA